MCTCTRGLMLHLILISCALGAPSASAQQPGPLANISGAVVVTPPDVSVTQQKAVDMLLDEVESRTGIRWTVANALPSAGTQPVIAVGVDTVLAGTLGLQAQAPAEAEAYHVAVRGSADAPTIIVAGHDDRGVLFGVGRVLRELRMTRSTVEVPQGFSVSMAPRLPIRGHQLGYRPKVNTYDGWTPAMYEQYIRDLAVFGANAIELIPPRSDDAPDSPHFVMPQIDMLARVSQIAHDYGVAFWLWYPAMDRDYNDPATVDRALKEWGDVFKAIPHIDVIFVPGGDPGHTKPTVLFNFLEKQTAVLHESHPNAQMWMSPQSFDAEWTEEFFELMRAEPAWLSGIVFGPQNRVGLPELRQKLPAKYPIRRYPDITHSMRSQYPVPDWDAAFALTQQREVINPRPMHFAQIFRLWDDLTAGYITYSEGVNDDVNKTLWSALGWDPDASEIGIMREYARYFLGPDHEEGLAQAIMALERNWQGPLLTNTGVDVTLQQVQAIERDARPWLRAQWRFQQILYRAYYDAFLRARLLHETNAEARAVDMLRRADELGAPLAISNAEAILDDAETQRVADDLRARVFELAEGLYQSIRMQHSVPRYQAIHSGRGGNLDLIDMPLNNRDWLKAQFAQLRDLGSEQAKRDGISAILNWTNPGPGGFYDDLGDPVNQPHLVRNADQWTDPENRISPFAGFDYAPGHRMSWVRHAETRWDTGLQLHYDNLDPSSAYTLRVIYGGDRRQAKIRCVAEDGTQIHDYVAKPFPFAPLEFEIPQHVTADGMLTLTFYQEPGAGGAGRGCQLAEVWLVKKR
jgi:hypothetical protein